MNDWTEIYIIYMVLFGTIHLQIPQHSGPSVPIWPAAPIQTVSNAMGLLLSHAPPSTPLGTEPSVWQAPPSGTLCNLNFETPHTELLRNLSKIISSTKCSPSSLFVYLYTFVKHVKHPWVSWKALNKFIFFITFGFFYFNFSSMCFLLRTEQILKSI